MPPPETANLEQDADDEVQTILNRTVEGKEAKGGEVGEGADEVALAPMSSRDGGRVEGGGRKVCGVAKVRILRVEGRLWDTVVSREKGNGGGKERTMKCGNEALAAFDTIVRGSRLLLRDGEASLDAALE